MRFFKTGLVKGILVGLLWWLIGFMLVEAIRVVMGLPPQWNTSLPAGPAVPQDTLKWIVSGGLAAYEPAMVVAAIFFVIGFMLGAGTMSDWLKWTRGVDTPMQHGPKEGQPSWFRYLSVDYSHKIIGVQYGVTAVILLMFAGTLALIFRVELAKPELQLTLFNDNLNWFNTLVSAHGMIMIGSILLGVGAMSNYLVPLMIGANDMAFPRLNAFAYWINVPGALLLVTAIFIGGWNTGWTGYPPLSAQAPIGVQYFFIGVFFLGLSSILGSLNIVVTTLTMRARGMTMFRMPIFVWAAFSTALIQLTATQLIGLSFLMVAMQRILGLGFFNPGFPDITALAPAQLWEGGGNPILFQHLFWFYSHPAVYIFILPGLGIISELLPVFSRKPLFGYKWIALSSLSIALVGFLVWAHHMFVSGMNTYLRVPFMLSTLLVAVPTGVKFFSWLGTLWGGRIELKTPMLFALGAISVFLIGGLTGPPLGTVTTDLQLHDTYYVVGHFHATMFGGFVFPFFAALYYWYPKAIGRQYNERLGVLHFALMTPAFWVMSLGQMLAGTRGMRRRVADYDPAWGIDGVQLAVTIAAFIIALSVAIMVINMIVSARRAPKAAANPWRSRGLEWQVPSPVPELSYATAPIVVGEPYDYGLAGSTYVQFAPPTLAPVHSAGVTGGD
ncbi:MAG: cbb3-type cytochrome c oxidase subunit I [Anaerolineae bacterium]|nr:cbb3-type cytochrome c oxidase subunit I [Anaerolineae bacterium]